MKPQITKPGKNGQLAKQQRHAKADTEAESIKPSSNAYSG